MSPRVLLVTGAYHPEISSGGQQCRDVARALNERASFTVLTTAVDPSLPREDRVDGVPVFRLPVDVESRRSRVHATWQLVRLMRRLRHDIDIVHIHGVSSKNVPVTLLARAFGMRVVVTMHTAGQDEPGAVSRRGKLAAWAFRSADRVLSVSPVLSAKYREAGLPSARLQQSRNGIDTERFRPVSASERQTLKSALGLPSVPVILFVGFFSRDKRPDVLFDAWQNVAASTPAALVCVGDTKSSYFEIDPGLATTLRERAERAGLAERFHLVDPTPQIQRYFQASDVFVLPSVREAMPLVLLEAMACGLPVVASRLPGATDVIVEDGANGLLVLPGDVTALAQALTRVLNDPSEAARMGMAARATIEARYSIPRAAEDWIAAYREVLPA
jgi:glycosyltransferase involved in cell wall biosynthesis